MYAGFAILVAELLWTYLGWLILLVGVQLSFYLQNPSYLRLGLVELRLSSVEIEDLALKVMFMVGLAHTRGEVRWRVNSLARELRLPGIAVAQVVDGLERAGLLAANDKEQLLPGRDIGSIPLLEVLDVARNQRSGHDATSGPPLGAVEALTARLTEARRTSCAGRTLRDLIAEG